MDKPVMAGIGGVVMVFALVRSFVLRRKAESGECLAAARLPRRRRSGRNMPSNRARPPLPIDPSDSNALIEQMLAQGRFALLLRPQLAENLSEEHFAQALGGARRADGAGSRRRSRPRGNRQPAGRCGAAVVSRPLSGDEPGVLRIRGGGRISADGACGTSRFCRPCWISSIAPISPAPNIGKTAAIPRARNGIRWWASVGTRPPPTPAGSASGCPATPNGSRRAAGRFRSRTPPAPSGAIPGAIRWTARKRTSGVPGRAAPCPSMNIPPASASAASIS